jgi:hypothetical protein
LPRLHNRNISILSGSTSSTIPRPLVNFVAESCVFDVRRAGVSAILHGHVVEIRDLGETG